MKKYRKLGVGSYELGVMSASIALLLCAFASLAYGESSQSTIADAEKAFLMGRYDRVLSTSTRLVNLRSSQGDELYYLKGLSCLKMDKFAEARESFQSIVSNYSRSKRLFDAYIGIADSYFLEGDINQAVKNYENILKIFSNDKNIEIVYYRLGNCYKNMGDSAKAKYYFDKVKAGAPFSFEARMTEESFGKATPSKSERRVFEDSAPRRDASRLNGYLTIQVGSFKNRQNAERITHKLFNSGYDSYMETPAASGDNVYRVKVGKYKSKEEALDAAARLKKLGYGTKICSDDVCQ